MDSKCPDETTILRFQSSRSRKTFWTNKSLVCSQRQTYRQGASVQQGRELLTGSFVEAPGSTA
ncbi:MAG: hypothetical protein ACLVAP_14310 [Parasutterella sp.]